MITCHLSKPESTLDQIKKTYPKLKATDAALVSTALVLSGRYALAVYDNRQYDWPSDYDKLTAALMPELHQIQDSTETPTKKIPKNAPEEEAVIVNVSLAPNYPAGEKMLLNREELKTLLSDILQKGVEFVYTPTDIGWQWSLDRANWSTLSGGDVTRRIKMKTSFTQGAVGTEMGTGAPKKRASKAKAVVAEEVEVEEAE